MDNIAYLPLDIPKIKFDLDMIEQQPFQPHHVWPDGWRCLPILGKTDKWDQESFYEAWTGRFEPGEVKTNPNVSKFLVDQIMSLVNQFPIEPNHVQILNQNDYITPHKDAPEITTVATTQKEPAGFKIILNDDLEKSFFVQREENGRRLFVSLPNDTNCFTINEHEVFHGSKPPKKPKYVVSCFGIIDDEKHDVLISKSMDKYGDEYGIFF